MDKDWKEKIAKDPQYAIKRVHAKNAYLSDSWIYSNFSHRWYTPEEFMNAGERVKIFRGRDDEKQFSIKDPRAGLEEMIQKMTKLQDEIEIHSRKMRAYFDLKNKKGK